MKNVGRFTSNLINCAKLTSNPLEAYGFLRSGRAPEIASFRFGQLHFKARKCDWVAIREVLVDDEYKCVAKLLAETSAPRVLDLGANIGTFAVRIFRLFPAAKVASVEAANDTFSILSANRVMNPGADWQTFHKGVWRYDGPLHLMRSGSSVSHRVSQKSGDEMIVGITLQTLLSTLRWDAIDLIKMDIEGGEEAVIPEGVDVLKKARFLIVEIHNDRIDARAVNDALCTVYKNCWRIGDRTNNKPLYVMSNENREIAGLTRVDLT